MQPTLLGGIFSGQDRHGYQTQRVGALIMSALAMEGVKMLSLLSYTHFIKGKTLGHKLTTIIHNTHAK